VKGFAVSFGQCAPPFDLPFPNCLVLVGVALSGIALLGLPELPGRHPPLFLLLVSAICTCR
jgi:hypothetical protein